MMWQRVVTKRQKERKRWRVKDYGQDDVGGGDSGGWGKFLAGRSDQPAGHC